MILIVLETLGHRRSDVCTTHKETFAFAEQHVILVVILKSLLQVVITIHAETFTVDVTTFVVVSCD